MIVDVSKPRVVHCKQEPYDVYIGRPSKWGNPFSHKVGTLAEFWVPSVEIAIANYEIWLEDKHPELIEAARKELKGKTLGCWCKTKWNRNAPCHGDVLLRIANEGITNEVSSSNVVV